MDFLNFVLVYTLLLLNELKVFNIITTKDGKIIESIKSYRLNGIAAGYVCCAGVQ